MRGSGEAAQSRSFLLLGIFANIFHSRHGGGDLGWHVALLDCLQKRKRQAATKTTELVLVAAGSALCCFPAVRRPVLPRNSYILDCLGQSKTLCGVAQFGRQAHSRESGGLRMVADCRQSEGVTRGATICLLPCSIGAKFTRQRKVQGLELGGFVASSFLIYFGFGLF